MLNFAELKTYFKKYYRQGRVFVNISTFKEKDDLSICMGRI